MNVLVLGSDGREAAIAKTLKKSRWTDRLYALPGNGGIAQYAKCLPGSVTDIEAVKKACIENSIDFCVVTPDDPLAIGMVDALESTGVKCFGPDRKASRIEASKSFAKNLMRKYGIPTASYEVFSDLDDALQFVDASCSFPLVIKADGLALGKGVVIASSAEEAHEALHAMMEKECFGNAGHTVVIEEFLQGPEVSVLTFTDGKTIVPMVSSMDHKRAKDNDEGLNTGGMGAVCPNPYYTPEIARECMQKIFLPTVNAMREEGCPFRGCLYFGLILTENGPKVIEYNSRFGDPETQAVLPLLESDLLSVMLAVRDERLADADVRFSSDSTCALVLASEGYPASYEKGFPITFDGKTDADIFIAGARMKDGKLYTSGGRVLAVTARAADLRTAVEKAYRESEKIHFSNKYFRKDIGKKALEA